MSNYAISFAASAYSRLGDEGSPITDLKNATALGITMRIRGDRLKNAVNDRPIGQLCAGYLELRTNTTNSNVVVELYGAGLSFLSFEGPALSSIDDTAYYTIRAWRDNSASPKFKIEVFKPDTTLLNDVSTSPADVTISNGTYGDFSLNFSGAAGASDEALVCDWAACWDRVPPNAGTAPSEPTGSDTGLLHWHKCDENGGTILDDQQSTTDAALTGSYSWILLAGATTSPPMFRGT